MIPDDMKKFMVEYSILSVFLTLLFSAMIAVCLGLIVLAHYLMG